MRVAILSTLFIAVVGTTHAEQTAVPTSYPSERYADLRAKSPFALATAPVAPPAPKADLFTSNLVLQSFSLEENDRGEEELWAYFRSRDNKEGFELSGTKANAEGISIASFDLKPTVGRPKVMLRKGDEIGPVELDIMPTPSVPIAPGPDGRMPQARNVQGVMPRKPGQPLPAANRIQIPRPNVVPQANGVPQANVAPQVNLLPAPGAPAPQPAGRRVRVIQSPNR